MDKIHLYQKALLEITKISNELKNYKNINDLKQLNIFVSIISSEENFFEFKMNFIQGVIVLVKNKPYLINNFIIHGDEKEVAEKIVKEQDLKNFIAKNKYLTFDKKHIL